MWLKGSRGYTTHRDPARDEILALRGERQDNPDIARSSDFPPKRGAN